MPDRILPELRRTAADAEAYARVMDILQMLYSDRYPKRYDLISPWSPAARLDMTGQRVVRPFRELRRMEGGDLG